MNPAFVPSGAACLVLRGAAAAAVGSMFLAHAAFVLDNTGGGLTPPQTRLTSLTTSNWKAVVFTTPASGPLTLNSLKVGLYDTGAATRNVYVRLFDVDGSNNPTGPALVAETFNLSLTALGAYYDLDLNNALWALNPSTTYALALSSDATSPTTSWTYYDPQAAYTAAEGYTYVGMRRTTTAGASWSGSTTTNALLLDAVVVPEPLAYGMATGVLLGAFGFYRRNRSH